MVIGRFKIFCLAYADDMVILALSKEEMTSMIKTLQKYLNNRQLELNVDKTKIVVFSKGSVTTLGAGITTTLRN